MSKIRQILSAAESLTEQQSRVEERLRVLQEETEKAHQAVSALHDEYSQDKLMELRGLYSQAENFQQDRQYDQAEDYYRQVLTKGGEDIEVLWRILLCHYCISYQKDSKGQMIPIILNPDLMDPAEMSLRKRFAVVLEKTETDRRQIYAAELAKIDQILDKYRRIRHLVDYDVFISVRQNDDKRHYTDDSDLASDLYDLLTSYGLSVFNSRRSKIPAGEEYEPYIIAALTSAKNMIVVGTSADNMNAEWVKNEWTRFQWLQRSEKKQFGKTDRKLFCFLGGGMQYHQIPKGLNPDRQAIKSGVGSDALLREALKVNQGKGSEIPAKNESAASESVELPSQVLSQMMTWLYLRRFDEVQAAYDKLTKTGKFLDQPRLHLYALCAKEQLEEIEMLGKAQTDLSDEPLFKLAMKLTADPKEKKELQKILAENQAGRSEKAPAVPPSPPDPPAGPKETKPRIETELPDETDKKLLLWKYIGIAAGVLIAVIILLILPKGGNSEKRSAEKTGQSEQAQTVPAEKAETTDALSVKLVTPGKLTVGFDPDYPPYSIMELFGTFTGFDVEVARAMAEKMGLEFEPVAMNWDDRFTKLDAGELDMIAGIQWTEGRSQSYLFSQPYLNMGPYLILPSDLVDGESINRKAISVGVRDYNKDFVEIPELSLTIISVYDDTDLLISELASGRQDGIVVDFADFARAGFAPGDLIDAGFAIMNLVEISGDQTADDYCMCVSKDNADLYERMEEVLEGLKKDGTLSNLSDEYFGNSIGVPE